MYRGDAGDADTAASFSSESPDVRVRVQCVAQGLALMLRREAGEGRAVPDTRLAIEHTPVIRLSIVTGAAGNEPCRWRRWGLLRGHRLMVPSMRASKARDCLAVCHIASRTGFGTSGFVANCSQAVAVPRSSLCISGAAAIRRALASACASEM